MLSLSLSRKRRLYDTQIFNSTQTLMDNLTVAQKRFCDESNLSNSRRDNSTIMDNVSDESIDRSKLNGSRSLTQIPSDDSRYLSEHRCGKILSIHLTNFMCHHNLRIDFDKRMNFLLGTNGSGKSAIMAALVLGLGSSARLTSRSSSIRDFIRVGQSVAKIEIVISNSGPEAYEPHIFGDRIIIVRTITHSSSTYLIKSGLTGNVIYRKANQLQQILLYHNIQVDNPVFVLNQDSSREFLKQLTPKKNYILFMKATQIALVTEKLNECVDLHKSHIRSLKNDEENLRRKNEELKGLKKDLSNLLVYNNLKVKIKEYEEECAWLRVQEVEAECSKFSGKLKNCEEEIQELQESSNSKEPIIAELSQQLNNFKKQIEEKTSCHKEERQSLMQLERNLREATGAFKMTESKHELLEKKKKRITSDLKEISNFIKKESQRSQSDIDAEKHRNEELIKKHTQRCANDLKPIVEGLQRDVDLFMDTKSQKVLLIEKILSDRKQCLDNKRMLQHRINSLKAGTINKANIYGNHMMQVLNEIKTAHANGKFKKMPIGPIGMHIELHHNKFQDAIENIIGTELLNSFIVNDHSDCKTLEVIFKRYSKTMSPIMITPFQDKVYDVSKGCVTPPPGTALVLNEIVCSEPMALNVLIDRVAIECILITDSTDEAVKNTSMEENVPHNLLKVIVPKNGNLMEFYPQPHYRMYTRKCTKASLLQLNSSQRMRSLEDEYSQIEEKLSTFDTDLKELKRQLPNDDKRIEEKKAALIQNVNEMRRLEKEIKDLKAIEYHEHSNEMASLKKEMAELERQVATVDQQLEEASKNKEKERGPIEEMRKDIEAKMKDLKSIAEDIQKLQKEEKSVDVEISLLKTKDLQNSNRLAVLKKEKKAIQENTSRLEESLKDAISKAEQFGGERVTITRAEDDILRDISRCRAKLEHDKNQKYDEKTLRELITHKEQELEKNQQIYDNLKISVYALRRSLKFRFDFLKKFKGHMGMLMKMSFEMILALREFHGEMTIDHTEKTLDIIIKPRNRKLNDESCEVALNSLSGGERSYSTVAFLLALWSCVDHPFYFLDEYDVYTDEINREFMTRLLIEEGRKRPSSQYTFLTPQLINVSAEDNIKIHRLSKAT